LTKHAHDKRTGAAFTECAIEIYEEKKEEESKKEATVEETTTVDG